jgi:glycosyltransferase involved in cell wall biosynthesis
MPMTINSMKVKPLIVSHSDVSGGAARAAYRLTRALREQNIDATMCVASKLSDDSYIVGPETKIGRVVANILPRINRGFVRLQKTTNPMLHSVNVMPGFAYSQIEKSNADVVNLHWINKEMLSIREIGRLQKPVVFTLHDMWAFCGAEHYCPDTESSRFRQGYCPENRSRDHSGLDIDRWTWSRKRHYWQTPRHVISPSCWLADCARESALMHGWPVHVVPNVLDVERFQPLDKAFCRQAFGLPANVPLIAFGAIGYDLRKGFDLLMGALKVLANDKCLAGAECVVFGQGETNKPLNLGFPLRFIERLHDDWSLALLYGAADVVVVPSRQENLPQAATEAHACGTPVVAFNTTGLPDVVEHKTTGYLAEPFSVEDLANGIHWVLDDYSRYKWMSVAARERAVRLWSPEVVVPQYMDIYQRAMND